MILAPSLNLILKFVLKFIILEMNRKYPLKFLIEVANKIRVRSQILLIYRFIFKINKVLRKEYQWIFSFLH